MSLRELYQEIIIDHSKEPRNFGKLMNANHHQAGHNPLCGDQLMVYVIENNGIVQDIHFEGNGCAISVASASLMTETVKGKSINDIHQLFEGFHYLVTQGQEPVVSLGKLAVFGGVAEFPVRVKCATLAWHTLKAALANNVDPVTTE